MIFSSDQGRTSPWVNRRLIWVRPMNHGRAGLEDFTCHDLRPTVINNWRLQGHDYFRIMAATAHRTMTVFKRYNPVSQEELPALVGEKI